MKEVKKMKKFVSVLLSVIIVVSMIPSAVVTAADAGSPDDGGIAPLYLAGGVWTSTLTFSGKTATCTSSIVLAPDESWRNINQRLEKQTASGTWEMVPGASWNALTVSKSYYYIFTNTKTVTSSGKYRVKSTFVVETPDGVRDTIIAYSSVVTV